MFVVCQRVFVVCQSVEEVSRCDEEAFELNYWERMRLKYPEIIP